MRKKENSDRYRYGDYLLQNPTWHVQDSAWKAGQILKMMKKNDVRPDSICEVGCGAGEVLRQLYLSLPEPLDFVGYDIAPQAIEFCLERSEPRLRFFLKDILEEENAFFDLILAIDVFEHVEDYYGFLRKLRSKAHYKMFHIPLDISLQSLLRPSIIEEVRQNVGHIHYFTKDTSLAALLHAGYQIIDHFYTPGAIEIPGKSSFLGKIVRKAVYGLSRDTAVRLLRGWSLMVLTT